MDLRIAQSIRNDIVLGTKLRPHLKGRGVLCLRQSFLLLFWFENSTLRQLNPKQRSAFPSEGSLELKRRAAF